MTEARIMAACEVQEITPHSEYVWLELKDEGELFHLSVYCHQPEDFFGNPAAVHFDAPHETIELDLNDYRRTWRCWTEFADDETRFSKEWDDD